MARIPVIADALFFVMPKSIFPLAAFALASVVAGTAQAATFSDYAGSGWDSRNHRGSAPGNTIRCVAGEPCSFNFAPMQGGDATYHIGGLSAKVTAGRMEAVSRARGGNAASDDSGDGSGFRRVKYDSSDEGPGRNEPLTVRFSQRVRLVEIDLRPDGHAAHWKDRATFLVNGENTRLRGTVTGLDIVGDTFTFAYGGRQPDQFNLEGLIVTPVAPGRAAIPEPDTYAMVLAGLGLLLCLARRCQGIGLD